MSNSLKEYSELFEKLALTELSVEDGEFKLLLKRDLHGSVDLLPVPKEPVVKESVEPAAAPVTIDGEAVKAPLLGIFYGKVGDREALKAGDQVKKGDVLCTIEAMKMMNEVKAPKDGTISDVLAEEGALVEYNQNLFIIK